MKVEIRTTIEVTVDRVRLDLPVHYDDEDMPFDFPFRENDKWRIEVDADTGRINNWPANRPDFDLYMKVTDGGSYYLVDEDGEVFAKLENDYVPHYLIPGEYGDYVELKIKGGVITNWKIYTSEFSENMQSPCWEILERSKA